MSAMARAAEASVAGGLPSRYAARLQRLATVLAIIAIVEAIGILLMAAFGDARFVIGLDLPSIGLLASVVMFPVVGALIIQRRPATRVAWLMILIGMGFGLGLLAYGYGTIGIPPQRPLPWAVEVLVAAQLFFVPIPGPAIAFLMLLYPSDGLLSPRWRVVMVIALVGAVLCSLGILFRPGPIDTQNFPRLQNPFGARAALAQALDAMTTIGNTMVTGAILLGAFSLIIRYRRADVVESAQIRWIALVAGIAGVAFAIAALQIAPASDVAFGIGLIALAVMPVAIGIAITRYRLYDIDRLINRALVYGSLTAILAGVFTAAIGLAQRVFVGLTGQSSDVAIVLTTLVVATLYAPLRKRLEAVIDRQFKYDEHWFGPYRSEIRQVLSVLEPRRAAQRLATEAVAELRATGGAVMGVDDRPTATAGLWPVAAALRLPVPGGRPQLAAIVVGPRLDGRPHDPRSIAELEELVTLVAAAVRLHGGVES